MQPADQQKFQRLIDEGYSFSLGNYISQGFAIFQKQMGLFIGFTFVFLLISMVGQFIPIVGPLAMSLFVSPALICGYYLVAHRIENGETVEFSNFFRGFDYIGQLALAALVMMLFYIVAMVPFFAVVGFSVFMGDFSNPNFPPWSILLMIPLFYIAIGYAWTNLFIVFYKMEFWPAMETSRKMITKNFWNILLFAIVVGLLAGSGIIALGVGLLATLPIALCAQYAAFADVTRLKEVENENEIVDHLVE